MQVKVETKVPGWRNITLLQLVSRVILALMIGGLLFNLGRALWRWEFDIRSAWDLGIIGTIALAVLLLNRESQNTAKP